MAIREEIRTKYGFGQHDGKIAAYQTEKPGQPRFTPLYEAVRARFPAFGYETEAVPRSKSGEQLVVNYRNYPLLLLDDGSVHAPPLVELAFNDRLREAPELVSDPDALLALRQRLGLRRRERRPRRLSRYEYDKSPHELDWSVCASVRRPD